MQRELGAQFPKTDAGWSAELWDMKAFRLGDRSRGLWLVFGAVALLWLIAMTNVAGLVLVETHRRARELAIRLAIGASRGHIVGVVVQEVLIVALVGSALGTLALGLAHRPREDAVHDASAGVGAGGRLAACGVRDRDGPGRRWRVRARPGARRDAAAAGRRSWRAADAWSRAARTAGNAASWRHRSR